MATQIGTNIIVGYKVEGTINTPPGATGAKQLRFTPGAGLALSKADIRSNEVRNDGLSSMGRHGSRMVQGSYGGELAVGAFDELLEAVMRSTWVAAVAITNATMTSITTTTSTIVAAAGSWLTQGVRVGDIVRLTGHSTTANNSKNLRVLAVTATTITVPTGDLTADAVADASFTLTILRKVKNGATPVRRSFYFDEYNQDIDQSEVFGGNRIVSMKITGQPDGMALIEFGVMGLSSDTLATAASPYFTTPTLNTATALVFADAKIRFNGVDIGIGTGFELTYQIGAGVQPVIGSTAGRDVSDAAARLAGSLSLIREDLS
nr:hypothetical protein [Gemmatimonadaceae bacterium]